MVLSLEGAEIGIFSWCPKFSVFFKPYFQLFLLKRLKGEKTKKKKKCCVM
jgi:hypothetical protein